MKKTITLVLCLLFGATVLTGCSSHDEPYMKKSYTSEDELISEVNIEVQDREIEVTRSEDKQIHIDYFENSKEYYDISVSESGTLTMTAASNKSWSDYIGGKAGADVRKISLQLPDELLENLTVSTTNENISVTELKLNQNLTLLSNGGNISFDGLNVGNEIILNVKNGNIEGIIAGSYDDYAISCNIKKGDSNLPSEKKNGAKKLSVTANNGNVHIEIL